jgi:hypothetical protein
MKRILILVIFTASLAFGQTAKPRLATLAQQKMCAEQARKTFHENSHPLRPSFIEWDYTSHYDTKLNQCFLMTADIDDDGVWIDVVDAFELREYASFMTLNKGIVGDCTINRPGHPHELCNSDEEFYTLVDKYFGIGR